MFGADKIFERGLLYSPKLFYFYSNIEKYY